MSLDPRLEERTLAYLFGDDEADPGDLVAEAQAAPDFAGWLSHLERDLADLARAVGVDPEDSGALGRLEVLRAEIAAPTTERSAFVPAETAAGAAPADDGGAPGADDASPGNNVRSLVARRRRTQFALIGGALAMAAALLVFALGPRPEGISPTAARPSVAQAQAWAEEVLDSALAFAGAELPPGDRGFLIGLVRDLSRPHGDGAPPSGDELDTARIIAAQALAGLGLEGDAEALRRLALGGCGAVLSVAGEVDACEAGLAAYAERRDAALRPVPPGDDPP